MKIKVLFELKKFLKSANEHLKEQVLFQIDLLERFGQDLRMPHSRALGDGLFELRIIGKIQIRIFYFFHKNTVYLLDIIAKKSQRLSPKDIAFARELKRQVERL